MKTLIYILFALAAIGLTTAMAATVVPLQNADADKCDQNVVCVIDKSKTKIQIKCKQAVCVSASGS